MGRAVLPRTLSKTAYLGNYCYKVSYEYYSEMYLKTI